MWGWGRAKRWYAALADAVKLIANISTLAKIAIPLLGGSLTVILTPYLKWYSDLFIGASALVKSGFSFLLGYSAILSLILIVLSRILSRRKHHIAKYHAIEEKFESIAAANASADARLFERLFLNIANAVMAAPKALIHLGHARRTISQSMAGSIDDIRRNIRDVLDSAVDVMKAMSGCSACAASLKFLSQEKGGLLCLDRDGDSDPRRQRILQRVNETPFNDVFSGKKAYFRDDNLEQWEANDGERYKDSEINEFKYNAILVVPVFDLANAERREILGILQIDNKLGGIANDVCCHYALELSWRLAVMLYRLNAIGTHIEKFERLSPAFQQSSSSKGGPNAR